MFFTACETGGVEENNNGNPTEQPGDNNDNNEVVVTNDSIATIEEQAANISATIATLQTTKAAIETTIASLALSEESATRGSDNNGVKSIVAALEERVDALEQMISNLTGYAQGDLAKMQDWAEATFVTMEQYSSLASELATLKAAIAKIEGVSTTELSEALAASEESMKQWVNEQLAGYATIADVDAQIAALTATLTEESEILREDIEALVTTLETLKGDVEKSYKEAIEKAINDFAGVISEQIAADIAAVNKRIDDELATINSRLDDIEKRLDDIEATLADLVNRIQSVSYIKKYGNKATPIITSTEGASVTLDFEISPKSVIDGLSARWEEYLKVEALYDETTEFIDMPITSFSADVKSGIITVVASGKNLSEDFYAEKISASVRLAISDGNNDRRSEYIPVVPKFESAEGIGELPANNEIFYITTDNQILEPNNEANFGANIVSNTYDQSRGCFIIKFDKDITKIGDNAFSGYTSLEKIVLPTSITTIGNSAFRSCTSLARIDVPKGITSIGEEAFYNCVSLARVDITDLLAWCKITLNTKSNPLRNGGKLYLNSEEVTELVIPTDITEIKDRAFSGCTSITSVALHDRVSIIGKEAFWHCSALANVTFDNCVTRIKTSAFAGCTSLKRIDITNLSAWCKTSIQNTDTAPCRYGAQLYLNGEEVTKLTIPADITKLGFTLFKGCPSLTSVTLHENVVSINSWAFNICKNLKSVYCKATTPPTARRGSSKGAWGAFSTNASGRLIYVPHESVDAYKAADGWSSYADSIVGYDFEKGEVEEPTPEPIVNNKIWYTSTDGAVVEPYKTDVFGANIVSNTYEDGKGVITFDNNVTSIGNEAFNNCASLTTITIPDGVTTIGEYAFYQCTALARINIPNSMTTIGEYSFRHCSSLKRVDITDLSAYLKISFNLYSGNPCRNGAKLYINDVEATEITIPSDITEITKCTFAGCTSITSVTFHEGITSIGNYAFEYCSALANVTFDNCVTNIKSSAFNGCTSLKRVDITNLSAWCKIAIQNTNTSPCRYGAKLYLNGEEVTELTIPADITSLVFCSFLGCYSLTDVTIHEGVSKICAFAFHSCINLKNVYCKPTTPPAIRKSDQGYWRAFNKNASGRKIYVPTESVDAYKAANGWSEYADSIVGYDF